MLYIFICDEIGTLDYLGVQDQKEPVSPGFFFLGRKYFPL